MYDVAYYLIYLIPIVSNDNRSKKGNVECTLWVKLNKLNFCILK